MTGKVTEKKQENGENLVMLETNVMSQDGLGTCPGATPARIGRCGVPSSFRNHVAPSGGVSRP